jgi:hypothetical protein
MNRILAITITILFSLWLASVAILLCFLAGLVGIPFLVGALVAQIGVAGIGGALLLVTNTRPSDATRPWGRRQEDKGLIETISEAMEREAAKRPGPARTPDWAIGIADSEA